MISIVGVISRLLNDYCVNGAFDAADYIAWRKGLGTTCAQTSCDACRSHFGKMAGRRYIASTNATVAHQTILVQMMFTAAIVRALEPEYRGDDSPTVFWPLM